MRKILLILALLLSFSCSHAQKFKTTGGCEYGGSIICINQDTASTFILTNGQSYSISVNLDAYMQDCRGDINILLDYWQLGTLPNVDEGVFTIPLNKFDLKDGKYGLQYVYTGANTNAGLMAVDSVIVVGTTGVGIIKEEGVNIYPIPASDVLYIDAANTKRNIIQAAIWDMNGRQMKILYPVKNNSVISIPVNDLSPGMYLLKLQTESGILNKKIVISRE